MPEELRRKKICSSPATSKVIYMIITIKRISRSPIYRTSLIRFMTLMADLPC